MSYTGYTTNNTIIHATLPPSQSTLVNPYTVYNGSINVTTGATLPHGWYTVIHQVEKLILVLANQEIVYLEDVNYGKWDLYSKVIKNQVVRPLSQLSTSGNSTVTPVVTLSSTPFISTPKNYQTFVDGSGNLYINVYGEAYNITDGSLASGIDPLQSAGWNLAFTVELQF